jgi:uncharacterized protein YqgV (UPF0045/DUF77 family)
MNVITAQLSVYPLKQAFLSPAIDLTLRILREHKLEVEEGVMSSLISGDQTQVFGALQEVFRQVAAQGPVVMVTTFSNACPAPGKTGEAMV